MLKVENLQVYGFEPAIRGMRNPMNSWEKSDSSYSLNFPNVYKVGDNDKDLMRRLFKAGTEHRKYMRQIQIWCDITAPFYWWKEFDTYKIGTTANSCSTMHKIQAKEFTLDDFSFEHWVMDEYFLKNLVYRLEELRLEYLKTKDKNVWYSIIQLLPTSYNQKRTVSLNYEVAYRIIEQRSHHKLDEWHVLVDEFKNLPFMMEIMEG